MQSSHLQYLLIALVLVNLVWFGGQGRAETYLVDFDELQAQKEMLETINTFRYQLGLPLVALDESLSKVSRHHALDMAQRDYFDHYTPDGLSPNDRVREAGLPFEVSENIGIIRTFGQKQEQVVKALMDGFLTSPEHLANLRDPEVTHIGIGFYQDLDGRNHRLDAGNNPKATYIGFGTVLVVQDFCRRRVQIVEPSPFEGKTAPGEFMDLRLDFDDDVREAFLRIAPTGCPRDTFEVPLVRGDDGFEARFAIDREGVFTISIYASTSPEDWFYREQGRLELTVKPKL